MDACEDGDSGSSSGKPRHTAEELFVAWILVSFAAKAVIGSSSLPITDQAHYTRGLYSCGLCERSFTTFQGLGGHIAGHNRQQAVDQVKNPIVPSGEGGSGSSQPAPRRQGAHRCWTCGKVFASGQALGGHMRAHYGGRLSKRRHAANDSNNNKNPNPGAVPSSSSSSSSCVNLPSDGNVVTVTDDKLIDTDQPGHPFDIDLNAEPEEASGED